MSIENIIKFCGWGEIYSYTIIGDPDYAPKEFQDQVPYIVALIKLEEGPLITSMLTDWDWKYNEESIGGETRLVKKFNIAIGDKVEMVTRRLKSDGERGLIVYGYKFRPSGEIPNYNPNP